MIKSRRDIIKEALTKDIKLNGKPSLQLTRAIQKDSGYSYSAIAEIVEEIKREL